MLEKAELTLIIMLSKTKKVITTPPPVLCSVASCKLFYSITLRTVTLSLLFVPPTERRRNGDYYENISTAYAAMAAGMILCAGEAVLAKFAEHYFKRELADGTPFDLGGAKELMRLGILAICIPIGTQIIAEIVYAVMEQTLRGVAPLQLDHSGSVALGVMFIVMSLGCRYGAELREGKE